MGNCFSTLRGKDHCLDDRAGKYEQLLSVNIVRSENTFAAKDGAREITSKPVNGRQPETKFEKSTCASQNTIEPENTKVLADACNNQETAVNTDLKENSSSNETLHADAGNAAAESKVDDGAEMLSLHLKKKDFEKISQTEPDESDSSPKNNMVGDKAVDLDDPHSTELDDTNFQSCSRNAKFGNEDRLVPSETDNTKVLADPCNNQETLKTEVKENSSSKEAVHVDVGNDVTQPEVDDRAKMFKKDFENKCQAEPKESDSSPKTNMVGDKAVDLDDPQTTRLDGANVQSCLRNAGFRNQDHLAPSEVKPDNAKVLADSCSSQKNVKAEVKENSSSEETVHVDVENDVAEPEVQDRAEMFKKDFEKKSEPEPKESDSSPKTNMVGEKVVDSDDSETAELDGANVQSCSRNAEIGGENDLVLTEIVTVIAKRKESEKRHPNESVDVQASNTEVECQEVVKDYIPSHEKKKTFLLSTEENVVEEIYVKDVEWPTGLFRMTVRWKMVKNLVNNRKSTKTFPKNKNRNGVPLSRMKKKIVMEKISKCFKAKKEWNEPLVIAAYLGAGWITVKELNHNPLV